MALRTSIGSCVNGSPGAIVLGLENAIALTVIRELGRHDVPVHGVGRLSGIATASRYCTAVTERPAGPAADWLPALIAQTGVAAVFAISEIDLLDLAQLPPMIGDCHILVPRIGALNQVLDKRRTLAVAAAHGLLVPRTWQPMAGDDFAAHAASMPYPLVAKWANPPAIMPLLERAGLEWIKAEYLQSPEALLALLARYRSIGIWPMVQQYCRGAGLGQMLFMDGGQATLRFQHRRLHEWPPEGGVSTFCRAEALHLHQAQMHLSEALLCALDWQGPAMVEYRYDLDNDRYWLMEVNGRFWGSLPLAYHCDAHFAWEAYRRAVLGQTDAVAAPRRHLRARYMVPETKRLFRLLGRRRGSDPFFQAHPVRDLLSYLLGFFDPRMRYYVFSLRDPRPLLNDLAQIFRKIVRRDRR